MKIEMEKKKGDRIMTFYNMDEITFMDENDHHPYSSI
jgi:hypothetical protein